MTNKFITTLAVLSLVLLPVFATVNGGSIDGYWMAACWIVLYLMREVELILRDKS